MAASVRVLAEQPALSFHLVHLTLLIEACLAGGETELALETADRGLAQVQATSSHYEEAELWRLRGEGLLQRAHAAASDDYAEAKDCFQRAIAIARQQEAHLWDTARHHQHGAHVGAQGRLRKAQQAREALASIYATFTEGLDTPDLTEARALLDGLARPGHPCNAVAEPIAQTQFRVQSAGTEPWGAPPRKPDL